MFVQQNDINGIRIAGDESVRLSNPSLAHSVGETDETNWTFCNINYVLNPICSFVNLEGLKKGEIDSINSKTERTQKYHELIGETNGNHNIEVNFLFLFTPVTIYTFSGVVSIYRNIIGHSLSDHSKDDLYEWY